MSVYTKPEKQPSDTIMCQNNFITSTIFIVFSGPVYTRVNTYRIYIDPDNIKFTQG